MNYLKIIFTVIWKLWFYLVVIIDTIFIGTIIYLLSFQKNDKITYIFMRAWAYVLFFGSGFSYSLRSKEDLVPGKNYILVSNHASMMDIALMFILHPNNPITFVGKSEIKKYPFFGRIYKKLCILVDRSSKESRKNVFPAIKKALEEKHKSVVIFAEGGVPDRDIILAPFKDGAFVSSINCNILIVVYAFHNLNNMFPFVFRLGYPGKIKVERLAILSPENRNKEELKQLAFHLIYEKIKDNKINHPELK